MRRCLRRGFAALGLTMPLMLASGTFAEEARGCAGRLGVSRTIPVEELRIGPQGSPAPMLEAGEVVLTYDDGPANGATREVLAALAEECVSATFFMLGQQADHDRALARRVAAAGHTIGTHTHSHPNLAAMPLAEAVAEIRRGIAAVRRAVPSAPLRLFRFPFLADSPALLQAAHEAGLVPLRAELDGEDWSGNSCAEIVAKVMGALDATGRGVVLLHDVMPNTACATRTLLRRLRAGGYRVVHLTG